MHKSEVAKRDDSIKDLTERYTKETDMRVNTENDRDDYKQQLEAAHEEIETQHNEVGSYRTGNSFFSNTKSPHIDINFIHINFI